MAKKKVRAKRVTARKTSPAKKKAWVDGRSKRKAAFKKLRTGSGQSASEKAMFAKLGKQGKLFKKSPNSGKRSRALGTVKRKSK